MISKRKLLRVLALLFLGAAVFTLIGSWTVGSMLLAPAPKRVILGRDFADSEVRFESKSGSLLRGNLLQGARGKGAIILMHGVRGNRAAMAEHAKFLRKQGFSVLIFDFQAHGESPGRKITNGYLESMDAAAAVDFVRAQLPGEKIGVLGISLGGAAAVLADPPLPIDALMLEMVYPDIDRAVKNRIALVAGEFTRPFSFLLTWQIKPRIGVPTSWFSPERAIARITCPKLIISGDVDRHTTLADTEALFAAAPEPKELWIVKNAVHENLRNVVGKEYDERVTKFFSRTLKQPEPQSAP